MGFIGLVMAIVTGCFTLFALIPFLGWLNWFIIPFALIALILSLAGAIRGRGQALGIIGAVLSAGELSVSIIRLIIGKGIL